MALTLSKDVTHEQIQAILEDLRDNLVYFRTKKDEKAGHTVIFMGYNNEEVKLQEAERLGLLKGKRKKTAEAQETQNRKRKEQEQYLHHLIIAAEKRKPFKVASKA